MKINKLFKYLFCAVALLVSPFSTAQTLANISEPLNVSIVPGDRSLTISWSPPLNTGGETIIEYVAFENRVVITGPPLKKCSTGSPSITTCTITDLQNGSSYGISVYAKTMNSNGQSSKIVHGTPTTPVAIPLLNNIGLVILSCFLSIFYLGYKNIKSRKK